ncbi:MAG: hypothetical protein JSU86_08290, partial [Phycisphaerales bacterium]
MRNGESSAIGATVCYGLIAATASVVANDNTVLRQGENEAHVTAVGSPTIELALAATPAGKDLQDQVHALSANAETRRYIVGGESTKGGTAADTSRLAYSNTLGKWVFGPGGDLADARIADDIVLASAGGCILDRYVIRVTGDRDRDGSGTALGAYTVNFGLYEACPGAGAGDPIQGTADQVTVPAEEAGDIYEIVLHPPLGGNVELPPNLYLGVRFSRDKCGVAMGAPPTLGFSADRFDFPGFPCAAGFGGFPDAPHASFYAEIYVEGDCPDAFVGYKNTNHAGSPYSAGVRARFADDVRLGVIDCNMVAYEIAHKGDG